MIHCFVEDINPSYRILHPSPRLLKMLLLFSMAKNISKHLLKKEVLLKIIPNGPS